MKSTFAAITLILGTVFTIPAVQADTGNIFGNRTNVDKKLNRVMSYPKFAEQDKTDGLVFVSFRIDEGGHTEILSMNASDERYAQHVENKLRDLGETLRNDDPRIGQTLTYKFTFRQE